MSATLSNPTVRIVLHGRLKRDFGGPFDWGVHSPKQAVKALCTMLPGFRQAFDGGLYRLVRRSPNSTAYLDEQMLDLKLSAKSEFHILPAARGAKNGGIGKIVLGAVLIAAAFALPALAPSLFGVGAGFFGASTILGEAVLGGLAKVGLFMAFDGVAQMLAPSQKVSSYGQGNGQSFILAPPGNETNQGGAIPVVYGQMLVGSVMISAGYSTNEFNPSTPFQYSGTGTLQPNDLTAYGEYTSGTGYDAGHAAKKTS